MKHISKIIPCCVLLALAFASIALAQRGAPNRDEVPPPTVSRTDILTPRQWRDIDGSVDRGLAWLASQQQRDGSFLTIPVGQPGITSLAVMAFLSAGHVPGEGPYGRQLETAVEFVLRTQNQEGLFSYVRPRGKAHNCNASHTAEYNHAIAGLMLGEVYGMCGGGLDVKIKPAIERGLAWTIKRQTLRSDVYGARGGWRYYGRWNESDLSLTSWEIMFLRSAKNAQFNVPHKPLKEAIGYVERCFEPETGMFLYQPPGSSGEIERSRGMVGGGILILSLAGKHNHPMAKQAGKWLLSHPFNDYNRGRDPYHYAAYYASQAMFQLGNKYWEQFYPEFSKTLVTAQGRDGAWDIERHSNGIKFGRAYTTSLAVMALTTPYQLLPIYQR